MPLVSYKKALELLNKGEVVAIPTETVYGLAGKIDSEEALKKIFQIKKRPFSDPLIVHFHSKEQMEGYVESDISFLNDLWDTFSPGPLTIVLKKTNRISPLITNSKEFVAVRIPRHPIMRRLLRDLKTPLAAPSANLFGQMSPTKSSHILSFFSSELPVLEGGDCEVGVESTLIKMEIEKKKIIILRPGSVTKKDIEDFLNKRNLDFSCEFQNDSLFPGGVSKHYAPKIPLVIIESEKTFNELQSFLTKKFPDKRIQFFSFQKSSKETAFHLYDQLNKFSEAEQNVICVQKKKSNSFPDWKAIWNRLEKASSFYFKL